MAKYSLMLGMFLLAFLCSGSGSKLDNKSAIQENNERPNVIIIMADDMGYGDLKSWGGERRINTPNIDRLTQGGLKFTNFHSNGVACSPTRASLMTGLYPQEAGIEGVVTAKSHRDTGMSSEKYTIADFFKETGYQTTLLGKWHLGYTPEFGPRAQGFDHFRGFVSGNVDYHSHIDQEGHADFWRNETLKPDKGYLTDLITDNGIEFITNNQDKPFFIFLAHGAPHYPYQGPNDTADRSVDGEFLNSGSRTDIENAYDEMIESLDRNIGRIISDLEEKDILDETLIIFLSDNGAPRTVGSNYPFKGYKGQVYEGSHRVPAFFYWKNVIHAGVTEDLMLTMDIFPTIAEVLRKDLDNKAQVSGISKASLLRTDHKKNKIDNERTVFWRFRSQKAALKGNQWKLVVNSDNEMALYDLSEEINETTNVKNKNPEIFQELKQALDQWEAGFTEKTILH